MSMQDETLKIVAAAMKLNATQGERSVNVSVSQNGVYIDCHNRENAVLWQMVVYRYERDAVEKLRGMRNDLEQMELEALQAMQPITERAS